MHDRGNAVGAAAAAAVAAGNGDREMAQKLYNEILRTANYFLHNSTHFSVELLARENPSYQEVAAVMSQVRGILNSLVTDFDPMMCEKAFNYCNLMTQMGVAISNKNQLELSKLATQLGELPGT